MSEEGKEAKEGKEGKEAKEAEVIGINTRIEGDLEITETAKVVDATTDVITTPWGSKVKADDVVTVLEEYYALSEEDKEREKDAWVKLISSMMGEREDGLKIVDIELSPTGGREIKFVYR